MAVVVVCNAIVDPGAVVIFLGDASIAAFAVLAPQGTAHHAVDAEICFVKFADLEEFVYYGLLLCA